MKFRIWGLSSLMYMPRNRVIQNWLTIIFNEICSSIRGWLLHNKSGVSIHVKLQNIKIEM